VAKDKSKAEKSTKPAERRRLREAERGARGGDSWIDLTEPKSEGNVDRLMLFTPLRKETTDVTRQEERSHRRRRRPHRREEARQERGAHRRLGLPEVGLKGALRGFIGERKVLGRLRKVDDEASAVGYHWELEDVRRGDSPRRRPTCQRRPVRAEERRQEGEGRRRGRGRREEGQEEGQGRQEEGRLTPTP
jgi:hypothetical protein